MWRGSRQLLRREVMVGGVVKMVDLMKEEDDLQREKDQCISMSPLEGGLHCYIK